MTKKSENSKYTNFEFYFVGVFDVAKFRPYFFQLCVIEFAGRKRVKHAKTYMFLIYQQIKYHKSRPGLHTLVQFTNAPIYRWRNLYDILPTFWQDLIRKAFLFLDSIAHLIMRHVSTIMSGLVKAKLPNWQFFIYIHHCFTKKIESDT